MSSTSGAIDGDRATLAGRSGRLSRLLVHQLALPLLQLSIVMLVISTAVFFLIRLSGDPAAVIAGAQATPEIVEDIRQSLGLNRPLSEQYVEFLRDAARLDLGTSFHFRQPAMDVVLQRVPASLALAGAAVLFGFGLGVPFGLTLSFGRSRTVKRIVGFVATIGQTVPTFALGIFLILIFAVWLGVLPSFGFNSAKSVLLPAVTLGAYLLARQTRLVASYTGDELVKPYVESLEAQGYGKRRIRYRYMLRNVALPLTSLLGTDLGQFFAGAVVVEVVFAWPGLGRLLVEAVQARDYPLLQATVLVFAIGVVLINFVVDRFYATLDPRTRRS